MDQTREEKKSLNSELDRLKDYSDYFSSRIDEISTNVNEVQNLKKSAAQEEQHYNQLNAIAQNLREEIFDLEDQVKNTVDETEEKVNFAIFYEIYKKLEKFWKFFESFYGLQTLF